MQSITVDADRGHVAEVVFLGISTLKVPSFPSSHTVTCGKNPLCVDHC